MVAPDGCQPRPPDGRPASRAGGDETAWWLRNLAEGSSTRTETLAALHDLLLRAARAEMVRRRASHPLTGPELDDLAYQAAADAVVAVVSKLGQFRGDSRFTTWAYGFAVFEVSSKLGRHFWRRPTVSLDQDGWDTLPDALGTTPDQYAAAKELVGALRQAVAEVLTDHQRTVFVALVVKGVPLDALAVSLGSSRNALYKTMFDARRRLRAALAAKGLVDTSSATGRS